jgi:hypothetical protein
VQALPQRLGHGLLDRPEERRRHRPELDPQREPHAAADRGRIDPQPDRGQERIRRQPDQLDSLAAAGRPFDADGRGLPERHGQAVLLGQGGLDDLLLHLAVERHEHFFAYVVLAQVDQRVLLGQLGQGRVQGAPLAGPCRNDDGLQARRGEVGRAGHPRLADRVADPHAGQAPHLGDPARGHVRPAIQAPVVEDRDRRDLVVGDLGPGPQRPREEPHVGDLLAGRAALHLEHRPGQRAVRVLPGGREQLGDAPAELGHPGAGNGRAEVDRVDLGSGGLRGQRLRHSGRLDAAAVDDLRQQRVVVVGQHVEVGDAGDEVGILAAAVRRPPHRHDRRSEPVADLRQQAVVPRAGPVDLVDEQDRRDAQALQRTHQHPGLRLHTLDGRDDQDGAVEHAEHPFHLGDEVRVAGRVDQVDRRVPDRERHDSRLDGDAAPALQLERVGLGAAGVDAADLVDDPRVVQEPLGQAGLTGVDMGQNSEIEQSHGPSSPSGR